MIVTPIISDSVTTATGITGNAVSVTADIGKDITADAEIVRSIVSVSGEVTKTITAEAELTTHVSFGDYDYYSGAYEVTPLAGADTILATKQKVLTEDVTVFKVPYFETSNEHGTTVYIAEA